MRWIDSDADRCLQLQDEANAELTVNGLPVAVEAPHVRGDSMWLPRTVDCLKQRYSRSHVQVCPHNIGLLRYFNKHTRRPPRRPLSVPSGIGRLRRADERGKRRQLAIVSFNARKNNLHWLRFPSLVRVAWLRYGCPVHLSPASRRAVLVSSWDNTRPQNSAPRHALQREGPPAAPGHEDLVNRHDSVMTVCFGAEAL